MKKTYITPDILIVGITTTKDTMIISSMPADSGQTITDEGDGGWVKEDAGSKYNVWDDDWSK